MLLLLSQGCAGCVGCGEPPGDAGSPEDAGGGGAADAGGGLDAGVVDDGGRGPDGGAADAGAWDAGFMPADDAGGAEDAGDVEDAGPGGADAGMDGGADAGLGALPPDPATVAPPDPPPHVFGATRFLVEGADPIQRDVAPGTIEPARASVVRGRALNRAGEPVPGVHVYVKDRPELGYTLTRADGYYDLVVNGGGSLVVRFDSPQHLPVSRRHAVKWGEWVVADDVTLVPRGPVTAVSFPPPAAALVRGVVESDAAGARQGTLVVGTDVSAQLELANGTLQSVTDLNLRVTEYTVGERGPSAMPAPLPPTSQFTYAAELEADEATLAGAVSVHFSPALLHIVENFLGFPVGATVPVGYYDRVRELWVPAENGRVVEVLTVSAGVATVDSDGDGAADDGFALALDAEELAMIGATYGAGETLWLSRVPHFSPWDWNMLVHNPAGPPEPGVPEPGGTDKDCLVEGSIIGCFDQTVGERIPLAGSELFLAYESDRVEGRAARVRIPMTVGVTPTDDVLAMYVRMNVAGQVLAAEVPPLADYTHTFVWDRRDAFGRRVGGGARATVDVGYYYPLAMQTVFEDDLPLFGRVPAEFDRGQGQLFEIDRDNLRNLVFERDEMTLPALAASPSALGDGWTLSAHHFYDARGRTLYLGDGRTRRVDGNTRVVYREAGVPGGSYAPGSPGGVPALEAELGQLMGVAVAADGTIWLAEETNNRVRRIEPDGTLRTVAGGPDAYGFAGDGGDASLAQIDTPVGAAVGPDGSFYFIDFSNERLRRVGPDGVIETVVGNGAADPAPRVRVEGGDPRLEPFAPSYHLDVDDDGNVYYVDGLTIRKLGPDGRAFTLAGTGAFGAPPYPADVRATAADLPLLWSVAVGPDGSVYFEAADRIYRVANDGVLHHVAGAPSTNCAGWTGPALEADLGSITDLFVDERGDLYFSGGCTALTKVTADGALLELVELDGDTPIFDGVHGRRADFPSGAVEMFTIAPNGDALITSSYTGELFRATRLLPELDGEQVLLASADASEVYLFDESGRHLETRDALTGGARRVFSYDAAGRLATVTDGYGNALTIERDADGAATAVIAPGGQATSLSTDADGLLTEVSDPVGNTWSMSYESAEGLLASFTAPGGATSTFSYDADGFLIATSDPAGGGQTLSREETATDRVITKTDGVGAEETFEAITLNNGAELIRHMNAAGGMTETLREAGGIVTQTAPDGVVVVQEARADPRFSMDAPVPSMTITTPGGDTATVEVTRAVTLVTPGDVLALDQQVETWTVNGSVTTLTYTGADRTLAVTTPSGDTRTYALTVAGDTEQVSFDAGLDAVVLARDAAGRVSSLTRGSEAYVYAYNADHTLASITDALGEVSAYSYDAAGRQTGWTLPTGESFSLSHDHAGRLVSFETPGAGAAHSLPRTFHGRRERYVTPSGKAHTVSYDQSRRVAVRTLPSGATLSSTYDGGRPATLSFGAESVSFVYAMTDGAARPAELVRAGPAVTDHTLSYAWDGNLVVAADSSGAVDAAVSYTYLDSELTQIAVASGTTSAWDVAVDDARALTAYGALSFDRSGPAGHAAAVTDDIGSGSYRFDGHGRLSGMTRVVNGSEIFSWDLTRDLTGRVVAREEDGGAVTWTFEHDANGRLTRVLEGATEREAYGYDADGSRQWVSIDGAAAEDVTFHVDGYPVTRGALSWSFDDDGFLTARGAAGTTVYSARGELLSASDGTTTATFSYDALGRRVATHVAGATTGYIYADPNDAFRVTHVTEPDGTLVGLLYDDWGHLFRIERDGQTYAVATDQVGTPRVVADSTGAVIKSIERDAFGNLLTDTNPAFDVYLGFAGGLEDPALGLVRFGLRDYDPLSGAFTAIDPALFDALQPSVYVYVDGDPVSFRDPSGLSAFCVGYQFYAGVGGGGQVCVDDDGSVYLCADFGLGFGAGFSASGGGAPTLGPTFNAEIGVDLGPISLGRGFSFDFNCVEYGPLVSVSNGTELGFGGKVSYSHCAQIWW